MRPAASSTKYAFSIFNIGNECIQPLNFARVEMNDGSQMIVEHLAAKFAGIVEWHGLDRSFSIDASGPNNVG